MIETGPTPTATASTHSSRIVVSACTVQTLNSSFINPWLFPLVTPHPRSMYFCNLYFIIFRHIFPTLCASHRSVTTKGSSLSNKAVIFCNQSACLPWGSSKNCLFSTIMKYRMLLLLFPFFTSTDCALLQLPGLHDRPPHPDQCRQGGQVSWQEVRGEARGSWPSSQARLASLTGLPAGSPRLGG